MNSFNDEKSYTVNDFLMHYKHTYINEDQYELVHLKDHLYFFNDLTKESGHTADQIIFEAVVHMQISLQIHDLVEFQFNPDYLPTDTEKSNQMNALVGDYHSSWFYKLLSDFGKQDALFHFVQPVKRINQLKMELLHNLSLTDEEVIQSIEEIYLGLYDAYAQYFAVPNYEQTRLSLTHYFVYRQMPFWVSRMVEHPGIKTKWNERKKSIEHLFTNCQ